MRQLAPVLISALTAATLTGHAPAQEKSLVERAQAEDGHWPAADYGGKPKADLRVTTWLLLACLGDGSNMRSGPQKHVVKDGVRWLRAQQDEEGRIGLRADPAWLLDHAMATFALTETERLSNYGPIRRVAVQAAGALAEAVACRKPAPGFEVRLWTFLTVESLRKIEKDETKEVAERIAKVLTELPAGEPGCDRERAAAELLSDLREEEPERLRDWPGHWPEELQDDPLHALYAIVTAYWRGGEVWKKAQGRINECVVKTQSNDWERSERFGTWDPKGKFGEENGRLGTTAINLLVLEHYYRYCAVNFVIVE